ncbi:MAG: 3-isopropylmalate dehydratase large subunit, partial [Pseudomonadales bacterium]
MKPQNQTLLDKIWDPHVVADLGDGYQLLHVDRHILHDLGGPVSLRAIQKRKLKVRNPELTFAVPDHCVSTKTGRDENSTDLGRRLIPVLRSRCQAEQITLFDLDDEEQGIVHVVGPELGLTLPGATLVCGDSHTCTHGAFGALAWGIGTSEVNHVLATQCVIEKKPRMLRISFEGGLSTGVSAKDMILYVIGQHGVDVGIGCAVEFAGDSVRRLSMEARMTLCNLSIELGSKIGQISPDDTTYAYLSGRRYAPFGDQWDLALDHWRSLPTGENARFDKELHIETEKITPQISWGTSPEHTIGIDETVPNPTDAPDGATAAAWRAALDYIGLAPGQPIGNTPVQRVFIGSCTNSRLDDLKSAAEVAKRGSVAKGVTAWVVPGSQRVKREAEALGLHEIFKQAGFEWREPGCSQCVAANGETVAPGERCISTSNRNFVGRQGPGARTHLASPATAALAAI